MPGGRAVSYSYDASGRVAALTYPDGTSKTYLYEKPYATCIKQPLLLGVEVQWLPNELPI